MRSFQCFETSAFALLYRADPSTLFALGITGRKARQLGPWVLPTSIPGAARLPGGTARINRQTNRTPASKGGVGFAPLRNLLPGPRLPQRLAANGSEHLVSICKFIRRRRAILKQFDRPPCAPFECLRVQSGSWREPFSCLPSPFLINPSSRGPLCRSRINALCICQLLCLAWLFAMSHACICICSNNCINFTCEICLLAGRQFYCYASTINSQPRRQANLDIPMPRMNPSSAIYPKGQYIYVNAHCPLQRLS